jgi:tetratricopeptide (TPR) repeat protein
MQGDIDGMIAQYQALLAIDSDNVQSLQSIAAGYRGKQEYDSALVYYSRLAELQPTDVQTRLDIAETQTSRLQFDEAREELGRARGVAPDDPNVSGQLARLDMQLGRYEDAGRGLEEMSGLARTAQQRNLVAGVAETYYYSLGQYEGLREAYLQRLEATTEFAVPIQAVQLLANSEVIVNASDWGREAYALRQVDSLRASVSPPWSFTLEVPAVQIHLDRGDVASARESLEGLIALNEAFGDAPGRAARMRWIEGRIAWIEDGACARAIDSFRSAQKLSPGSSRYRAWSAACLTELERWDEAEAEVADLLERFPGDGKIRLLAANLYAGQARTDDAIAELEVALGYWSEADPDFRPAQEARDLMEQLRSG